MAIKQDVFPVAEVASVLDKALDKALADLHRLSEQIERNEWEILRLKVRSVGEVFSTFSSDGVLFVSQRGRILHADSKIEKIFGYTAEELTRQKLDILFPVEQSEDRGQLAGNSIMVKEHPFGAGFHIGSRGLKKDGTQLEVGVMLLPGRIEGEQVFCLICTALE